MPTQVSIQFSELDRVCTKMKTASSFLSADTMTKHLGLDTADTGSADITDALNDVHGAWSDKRGDLSNSVNAGCDFLTQLSAAFGDLDAQLAAKLTGECS